MKSQKHNVGELRELTVKIEKNVVESLLRMSEGSGLSVDDLVVIALKRFRGRPQRLRGQGLQHRIVAPHIPTMETPLST